MKKQRSWMVMMAVMFLMLQAVAAQATPIRADFTAHFFLPPSPINPLDERVLATRTLEGAFSLFSRTGRTGTLVEMNPGPPQIRNIAYGDSGISSFIFDLDLTNGAVLYFSFTGSLVEASPGPPQLPVYAFAGGQPGPPQLPEIAPLIELGEISVQSSPGPPTMPLFAFASPGHEIGDVAVHISAVPEPGTFALLLIGIGGIGVVRRVCRATDSTRSKSHRRFLPI